MQGSSLLVHEQSEMVGGKRVPVFSKDGARSSLCFHTTTLSGGDGDDDGDGDGDGDVMVVAGSEHCQPCCSAGLHPWVMMVGDGDSDGGEDGYDADGDDGGGGRV